MNRVLRIREADRAIFNDLTSGRKSIETRACTMKYQSLQAGDTLTFACGKDRLVKTIRKVHRWRSVAAMARAVPLKRVMPQAASLAEAKRAYESFSGYAEKVRAHGLVGFELGARMGA